MQAVKVSQCVQIGSNLIYGYYDEIDSIGLTLLLRMLANIKIKHEDVRQFDQLEDVYSLL